MPDFNFYMHLDRVDYIWLSFEQTNFRCYRFYRYWYFFQTPKQKWSTYGKWGRSCICITLCCNKKIRNPKSLRPIFKGILLWQVEGFLNVIYQFVTAYFLSFMSISLFSTQDMLFDKKKKNFSSQDTFSVDLRLHKCLTTNLQFVASTLHCYLNWSTYTTIKCDTSDTVQFHCLLL